MRFIRPKIIGTLKIEKMMNDGLAVLNDIKSTPNKIIIPCDSKDEGLSIIEKIKNSKPGEILYF
jgi:hypothetical protein